jgi:hypothetical protein
MTSAPNGRWSEFMLWMLFVAAASFAGAAVCAVPILGIGWLLGYSLDESLGPFVGSIAGAGGFIASRLVSGGNRR